MEKEEEDHHCPSSRVGKIGEEKEDEFGLKEKDVYLLPSSSSAPHSRTASRGEALQSTGPLPQVRGGVQQLPNHRGGGGDEGGGKEEGGRGRGGGEGREKADEGQQKTGGTGAGRAEEEEPGWLNAEEKTQGDDEEKEDLDEEVGGREHSSEGSRRASRVLATSCPVQPTRSAPQTL